MPEMRVWSLGQENPLEESMATHPSTPAWRVSWTEEPGGLQSMGPQRVGPDWSDLAGTSFGPWSLEGSPEPSSSLNVHEDFLGPMGWAHPEPISSTWFLEFLARSPKLTCLCRSPPRLPALERMVPQWARIHCSPWAVWSTDMPAGDRCKRLSSWNDYAIIKFSFTHIYRYIHIHIYTYTCMHTSYAWTHVQNICIHVCTCIHIERHTDKYN